MTIRQPQIVVVAEATAEHPRNSEPAILQRQDGTLFMVWQEYLQNEHGGHDNAPNQLSAMTSADGGLTWGSHQVLVHSNPGDVNVYSPNLLQLPCGDWLLLYFRYHVLAAGKESITSAYVCRSADQGRTFGPPRPIWDHQRLSCASGVVKRLRSGRIVLPVSQMLGLTWTPTDHVAVGSYVSDDDGATWRFSSQGVDLPLRGAMEAHVEELRDGRLLMVMRTQLGSVFQSHSADGGLTWSKAQTTGLRSPESCPELIRIPQTGDLMIVWNNSPYDPRFGSHYGKRSPLTVAVSGDEGATWGRMRDIETDPGRAFSNPVAFAASGGRIVLMYWTCPYFTDRWLMNHHRLDLRAALFDVAWLYS